jgi:hypothetical protein
MRFLLVSLLLASSAVVAQDGVWAVAGGLNFSKPEVDGATGSVKEAFSANLLIGGRATLPLADAINLRSGLFFGEKTARFHYVLGADSGDISAQTVFLSLPLTLQLELSPKFAVFGGYVVDYNVNSYCKADGAFNSCVLDIPMEDLTHYGTLGAIYHSTEKMDLELSYQHAISETFEDIKVHSFQVLGAFKF